MNINQFKQLPLMGILRGVEEEAVELLVEAIVAAGLETIEVTMNTPRADKVIQRVVEVAGGRLTIGAGTVLTMGELHTALDSGASFIVLPTVVDDVVAYCAHQSIPVFPGAFTPQEIYNAWQSGATMVKVFPAKFFGPAYFKELRGPFHNIELLACGGVTVETVREFFSCGASAVAFGGSVFKKEWLAKRSFAHMKQSIKELIEGFKSHKDTIKS